MKDSIIKLKEIEYISTQLHELRTNLLNATAV